VLLLDAELEPADCVYCMIQGCLGTSASFMRLACSFTSSLQGEVTRGRRLVGDHSSTEYSVYCNHCEMSIIMGGILRTLEQPIITTMHRTQLEMRYSDSRP
jgi:hypothetical protein